MKFAAIGLPQFSLQALLRHEPRLREEAVAALSEPSSKAVVIEMTEKARAAGVQEGMTAPQAMARCPNIQIKTRSERQEQDADEALRQFAYSITPYFEATAPGVVTLDLRGLGLDPAEKAAPALESALEQKNDPPPVERAREWGRQLVRLQFQAVIGLASTPLLARQAARSATPADPTRFVENPEAFFHSLPIGALELSEPLALILRKWGIRTVGAFKALGVEELAKRLGPEARAAFQRASADWIRPLNFAKPPETFQESMDYEHPVETLEPLLFILRRFLEQIAARLEWRGWAAKELALTLFLTSGERCEQQFSIPSPTREVDALFRMLHTRLENFRTERPIAGLALKAAPTEPAIAQFGLFETMLRHPGRFHETLARLTGLTGSGAAGAPVLLDTHRPDAFRVEPVDFDHPVSTNPPPPAPAPSPIGLVLRRFRPPQSLRVKLEGDRPAFLDHCQCRGAVQKALGPWRVSGEWWHSQAWDREEWDVQLRPGELYRVCRENNQWFLEGVYD